MYCRICAKHLYENIDFGNIFKWNNHTHFECEKYIVDKWKYIMIPIEQNEIKFYYKYDTKKIGFNYEYLWSRTMWYPLSELSNNEDWSIAYFYEENQYDLVEDIGKYLLLKLAKNKLIFISLFAFNLTD